MRQRIERRLPDRCDIVRRVETGTGGVGGKEPTYDDETVASSVPCAFDDESTTFVRLDTGERVQRPASVRFAADVDVRAGDRLDIDGVETDLEVRGVDERRDHRRGRTAATVAEVERA